MRLAERWYGDACRERAAAAFSAVEAIRKRDSNRRRRSVWHACLYGDGATEQLSSVVSTFGPRSLQFNVVRRNVDTTQAKIAKARPVPMALTSGGDIRQQRRAQRLSKFFSGMFDELEVFETSELVARDALIFGTGLSHTYRDDAGLHHERVLLWEVDVDPGDARYGSPRCIYRHKWRDKHELAEEWPEHEAAILAASTTAFDDDPLRVSERWSRERDEVVVLECWRLPSREGAGDGRHMLVCGDAVLVDEEYVYTESPIIRLHCSRPLVGYWGDGFGHVLEGIQYELNSVAAKVQDAQYMMGTYAWTDGNGLNVEELNNGTMMILTGGTAPPAFMSPNANAPQTLQYLEQLRGQWSYEESGTSQLSAQSQKPAGLNSGAALRTFTDIESERFVLFGKQFERYHVQIGWQIYRLAEEAGDLEVRSAWRRKVDRIAWRDVKIDRAELVLRVFPTSALSQDPAQRRAEVAELAQGGLIPPDMVRSLLDLPDLEEYQSVEDAPRQLVEDVIWRILDDEEYISPEPSWNLQLCVRMASLHRARAWVDGAPPEALDLLMRFATDAQSMLDGAQPPPAPPMAPPAPGPVPPEVMTDAA